jgi:hypothetical protein
MADKIPRAIKEGPLTIGGITFNCAVLDDERNTRVVTEMNFMRAMGMYRSGALSKRRHAQTDEGGAQIPLFLAHKNLKPYAEKHLGSVHFEPLKYQTLKGGSAHGIKAELIPMVCEVWIDALEDGVLGASQQNVAAKAKILFRGFAHVGIIALVDEATGWQETRDKLALQAILDEYLDTQFAKWAKRFPDEFYEEMFKLRGWQWKGMRVNRPQAVAGYTKDLVYARMLPGLVKELETRNPIIPEKGRRKGHHHRLFTADLGVPELTAHIHAVTALMKASTSWDQFKRLLQRAFPKLGSTFDLPLGDSD